MKTQIISAFPATGKSFFYKNNLTKKKKVLDSDSSTFNKENFPQNYIEHIKNNIGKVDIILVSSHEVVREALVANGIKFTLVFPTLGQLNDYKDRMRKRGNLKDFINLIQTNWNKWITSCCFQDDCEQIILKKVNIYQM